ncbi:E3 ubiquitin-protein ligase TRIM7-like [Meleagris gallopavo]|uniref:E3 ubiquitin-protein ligase TRIM7-like n=1 Tax=Meleagris gallopavo TaxID=9103 RepID=UPI000549DD8B|nr:E3 ubiquitin-protein ligase TRIM7-like [Meleagris gallopavo]
MQILKEKKEKLQGLKEAEEGKSLEFLEKVQQERQKVVLDIKELQKFVEEQERLLLGRLEKLDQEIVRRKEENLAKILEEISSISEQIRELEEKCQQPPCEFLQDSRNILSRLENEKSQKVAEILPGAEENPTSPAQKNTSLKETLMQFRGREEKG